MEEESTADATFKANHKKPEEQEKRGYQVGSDKSPGTRGYKGNSGFKITRDDASLGTRSEPEETAQLHPKAADEEGQPAADQGHTKRIKRSAADNEQPSTGEVIQTVGEGPGPTPALTGESVCITSPVGGCVVAAVAVLLGLPDENVRHLLQTKLREMNQHGSADIGNAESDLYHVTVAMEVLKAQGKQVERVRPKELHRMFQKGAKALLLGRLNFNFQPYKQRTTNSKVRSPSQFLQALPNHTARVPVYCWCSADRVADPRLQEG